MSQDNGSSLEVQGVKGGGCHICRDPLTIGTLDKVEDLQGALCSCLPGNPDHLQYKNKSSENPCDTNLAVQLLLPYTY